jgi:Asp-tRNA(Asn)/Glu-tRNA(Gln) amidotransferase A subunit family amidase
VSELTVKPAVELLSMLQQRTISAVELAEEHAREIERLNPSLHAYVDFDKERFLRSARESDEMRVRLRPSETDAPLLGLPISIKASIATAGYLCETGSILNREFIAQEDAVAVARMRRSGALITGTTNCPEFLMAYETDNLLYGATANPWSLQHSAGGSSGGEASAIAAGLSAGGIGSDSGGSVREPAHFTGICSLKPTPGRIPSKGHLLPCVGPFSILGALGPMARTMRDVSLYFQVLSGHDPSDPVGVPGSFQSPDSEQLRSRPIGVLEDDGLIPVTLETRLAMRSATKALEERGFQVTPFRSSTLETARTLWWTFFIRCGRMLLEPLIAGREIELSSTFRYFLDVARKEPSLTGDELLTAWTQLDQTRALLMEELEPYSSIITPVCSIPAFKHGEREWKVEGQTVEYFSAMRFTQWFNLLGAPAAVVPVGRSDDGLPIGVQIASRPYFDESVLAIAELLDQDFGYQPPPLAVREQS